MELRVEIALEDGPEEVRVADDDDGVVGRESDLMDELTDVAIELLLALH